MTCRLAVSTLALVLAAGPVVATPNLAPFARCLTKAGATYYTADWCPHCRHQDALFGPAIRWVHTVDCTLGCDGIPSFPTWTFRKGPMISGVAELDVLEQRTGCAVNGERDDTDDPARPTSTDSGHRERYMGGAKFIEVR
jgi:hypothetical protein